MSPTEPTDIRVSQAPATNQDIYVLERACLQAARAQGKRGRFARVEAARIYNSVIAEARRMVREPRTQPGVLAPPVIAVVPTPAAPRGMEQRDSGLYVPEEGE